jgi:hypothetical protein
MIEFLFFVNVCVGQFPATCYRPGSVVGDLWWLAGGHVFGGQVHNSQDAYEKFDGKLLKLETAFVFLTLLCE